MSKYADLILHDHKLLVKYNLQENVSHGGILLAKDTTLERKATVLASGSDTPYEVGSTILVSDKDGFPFNFEGEDVRIVHKDAVILGLGVKHQL